MLHEGQQVELAIEKPAAGGWMIARHLGQVVLVRGAIPGERVKAWVDRAETRLAYATTREVVEPSADRRVPEWDPLCGGSVYAHIAYPRQLALKSDILVDAFARLARFPLAASPIVDASPEQGYRMRARFHVKGTRAGFYREGTHQLCDAASTHQMTETAAEAANALARGLQTLAPDAVSSIALTENVAGAERAAHVEFSGNALPNRERLEALASDAGLAGISAASAAGGEASAGDPIVTDALRVITQERATSGVLRRHAAAFFQGNRYLLASLVTAVLDEVPASGHVLDLYAGVGLFAASLAATGRLEVTAVESDRASGADLRHNARAHAPALGVHLARVEDYFAAARPRGIGAIVMDPPRTGLSKAALEAIVAVRAPRLVYVSCDPATLARDARRLLDAGYALQSIRGFDLFPNTAHVEALAVFRV